MQCHEFEARLQELLDERLSPAADPALSAHAAQCSACRGSQAVWSAMLTGISAHPRPAGRADLAQRVLAELRMRPADDKSILKPALRWAAAALLIATTLALWNAPDDRPVAEDAPPPAPQWTDAPPEPRPVDEPAAPASDLGSALADAWLLAPGFETPESTREETQESPEPSLWGAELSAGLRPLADSTSDAWDFLMTALPAPGDAAAEPVQSAPAETPTAGDET